jgi:hypothetical protein
MTIPAHDWQHLLNGTDTASQKGTETASDNVPQEAVQESQHYLTHLQTSQRSLYERAKHPITFSNPMLSLGGEIPLLYPNTINVISAKTGKHKTRFAELLCSVILKNPACNDAPLNILAREDREFAVVYVDTERNLKEQLPYSIQNIRAKAGYSRFCEVDNFECISLLEIDRPNRFHALREFLDFARKKFKGRHLFVVLDVVSDCCENFNDPRYTMPLVDALNSNINRFDVTFLCVIHQNPSLHDDKARGHLGTELENKASTIITLGMDADSDLIRIACKKQRTAKPFEAFFAKYSEEEHGLVLASDSDVQAAKATQMLVIDWKAAFGSATELASEELKKCIVAMYGVSKSTAARYISDAARLGEITKTTSGKRAPYCITTAQATNQETETTALFSGWDEPENALLFGND